MIKNTFLSTILLLIVGISIWIQVVIPEMRGDFYNALILKDLNYQYYFYIFLGSLLFYYIADSIRPLIVALLGFRIRQYMVAKLFNKPICLEENADGRIAEDVRNYIETAFGLMLDLTIAFFAILGLISQVPHDLVVPAIVYTLAVTLLAILFNKPLVRTQYDVQAVEQTFRMDIRSKLFENSDSKIKTVLEPVYSAILRSSVVLTWFRTFASIKMLVGVAIPFAILIPLYMDGNIDFKVMIQGVSTFDLLVSNTTILVNIYPFITKAMASRKRIKELRK